MNVDNIEAGWKAALAAEFEEPYMLKLDAFLAAEKAKKKTIYPCAKDWFNALRFTPLDQVKVVILGQDPYHGPDQAHGLAFSVKPNSKVPPSLVNIYKELESDLGIPRAKHGYLESWANQGVLLLNAVLTVEMSKAASHQKQGWEQFTDHIIHIINEQCKGVVFMLWGSYAQKKCVFINKNSHLVLESAHPSPLSAHRGFLGCRHFSQVNSYLQQQGKTAINWQLPDQVLDVDGSPRFELIG